ncbi:MAG TPA: hypothetical protein VFF20_01305 [Pseudogracilibacillus sp.]|nr:hypothetical protein [Pseudogracilibacillus sp.]
MSKYAPLRSYFIDQDDILINNVGVFFIANVIKVRLKLEESRGLKVNETKE